MGKRKPRQYATGPRDVVSRKHRNVEKVWFYEDKSGIDVVVRSQVPPTFPVAHTAIVRLTWRTILEAAKRRGRL